MTAAVAPEAPAPIMTSKGVEVRQPDGDEGSRWYVDPETGDLLASVTTAISSTTSKPWLVQWSAKLAAEAAIDEHALVAAMLAARDGDEKLAEHERIALGRERRAGAIDYVKGAAKRRREHAQERGTWVHDVVEALVLDQPVPEMREDVKPYVDQFVEWWCDFAPVPFMSEATVADPDRGWAGTLDLGAYLPTLGLRGIIDVKTGANLDAFMPVQVGTYRKAKVVFLPHGQRVPMPKSDRGYVLWLTEDSYKLVDVTYRDGEDVTERNYGVFLGMLDQLLWRDQQKGRVGTVIYPPLPDGSQPSPLLEDVDGIPARSALVAVGIERVADLFEHTADDLLAVRGFGPVALRTLPDVCALYGGRIRGLAETIARLDAEDEAKREKALALAAKRSADHDAGKHDVKPIKGCATCAAAAVVSAVGIGVGMQAHFDGCPTPVGAPYDCDYCQARTASMEGV